MCCIGFGGGGVLKGKGTWGGKLTISYMVNTSNIQTCSWETTLKTVSLWLYNCPSNDPVLQT